LDAEREADHPLLDQGWQRRRFWLVCNKGGHQDLGLDRLAHELQTPAEHVVDSAHPGTAPWERSYISLVPPSLSILAVKQAEDGSGVVLRMQEMRGHRAEARLEIPSLHVGWRGAVAPWEIKTLRISKADGRASVIDADLLERC
jgi:alpha-mannosidase